MAAQIYVNTDSGSSLFCDATMEWPKPILGAQVIILCNEFANYTLNYWHIWWVK